MSSWSGSAPTRVTTSVLLCGYYGEHNLGDDALLAALLAQLPPSVTPLVTAFDQDQITRQHGVASVNRNDGEDGYKEMSHGCRLPDQPFG